MAQTRTGGSQRWPALRLATGPGVERRRRSSQVGRVCSSTVACRERHLIPRGCILFSARVSTAPWRCTGVSGSSSQPVGGCAVDRSPASTPSSRAAMSCSRRSRARPAPRAGCRPAPCVTLAMQPAATTFAPVSAAAQQRLDRVLFPPFHEAARVDQDDVGALGVGADLQPPASSRARSSSESTSLRAHPRVSRATRRGKGYRHPVHVYRALARRRSTRWRRPRSDRVDSELNGLRLRAYCREASSPRRLDARCRPGEPRGSRPRGRPARENRRHDHLRGLVPHLADAGGWRGLGDNIGNYNAPFLYFLR